MTPSTRPEDSLRASVDPSAAAGGRIASTFSKLRGGQIAFRPERYLHHLQPEGQRVYADLIAAHLNAP